MSRSNLPGTTRTALCLALILAAGACAKPRTAPNPHNDTQVGSKANKEVEALVQDIKKHPSMQAGSNEAGAPIHVDPYPHSSGMSGMGHQMGEKWNEAHSTRPDPKK